MTGIFSICFYKILFFFSKQRRHKRWPRDWSSDVCPSDPRNNLLQSGQQGFVIRTPLFKADDEHLGFVSIGIDLERLLQNIGYDKSLGFDLMIEAYHSDWDPQILRGSSAQFDALPEGPQITVPEGSV